VECVVSVDALRESTRLGTPQNIYKKPNWKRRGPVVIANTRRLRFLSVTPTIKGIVQVKKQSPRVRAVFARTEKTAG
jgi:hypothetical protein